MTILRSFAAVFFLCLFSMTEQHAGYADTALDEIGNQRRTYAHQLNVSSVHAAPVRSIQSRIPQTHRSQRFAEFRGEADYLIGNTSIVFGTLGPDGEPLASQYASFQPAHGIFGLIMGNFIPWKSYVGAYPWNDVLPPMVSFRVLLTEQEYQGLAGFVEDTRRSNKKFYLFSENCVRFARDAARVIGLKAPEGSFVYPPVYVNMLRIMNSDRQQ